MKRFQTKVTISVTTSANSKENARYKFIMKLLNHINLTSGGEMLVEMSDKEFENWDKKTKKLPF